MQADMNARSRGRRGGIGDDSRLVGHDRVAALQYAEGTELREFGGQTLQAAAVARDTGADSLSGGVLSGIQASPVGGQTRPHVEAAHALFEGTALPIANLDRGAHAIAQAVLVLIGL